MKRVSLILIVFLLVSLVATSGWVQIPQVKAQEQIEGWVNRYSYEVDYGNGTHSLTSHIGVRVFWNNQTEEWQELLIENHTDAPNPHYLVRNAHITAKIGLYEGEDAVLYYDPDYTRRICAERWNVQGYIAGSWQTLTKTFYGHEVYYDDSKINVTGIFATWFNDLHVGWLRISYILKPAAFLKHEVAYKSIYDGTFDYRVVMTLIGMAGKRLVHTHGTIILNETQIEGVWNRLKFVNASNPQFQFLEEKLDSLGHYFLNETTGQEIWINDYLKVIRLKEITYWGKQLIRCDIVIGNYTLAENEILFIDPDTDTWNVSADSDDCGVWKTTSVSYPETSWAGCNTAAAAVRFARHSTSERWGAGLRWIDVDIPQATTIDSAYFGVYCYSDRSGSVRSRIYGEDADNASTFSDVANFNSRSKTGNYTIWNFDGDVDTWHTSPDIKLIIQEIVDRSSFDSYALALHPQCREEDHDGNWDDLFRSHDSDSSKAANLTITWTTGIEDEYEYNLTAIVQPSESLDYDAEKDFEQTETIDVIESMSGFGESYHVIYGSVNPLSALLFGIEVFLWFSETITVPSYMVFQKEVTLQLFELLETVRINSVLEYGKETIISFFEFFESVHPYALLDYDFEVITPSVDVTTFGTIAFVIAIIALAIGIVAFTRGS